MAELIQQLDGVLTESWAAYGIILPAYGPTSAGLTPSYGLYKRGLIAKCCSAVFEKVESAVSAGIAIMPEDVKIAVVGAQGFVQGFWGGIKNDYNNVAQFVTLVRHPIDTSKAIYEGFRGMLNMGLDGLKQIPKKMLDEYLTTAQKNLAWLDPDGDDKLALISYTVGYSAGFLTEQILVSTVTGIFKAAVVLPVVARVGEFAGKFGNSVATMMSACKAGQKMLGAVNGVVDSAMDLAARAQKAKNLVIRSATQFVKEKTGVTRLEEMAKELLPSLGREVP